MSRALELLVARHGETTWNREKRSQGQRNPGLSELGKEQARELGERLAGEDFSDAICSDLRRCRETLELALGDREVPTLFSKRFRERRFGVCEGLLWREALERYGASLRPADPSTPIDPALEIEHPLDEFRPRVLEGLRRVHRKLGRRERAFLMTHGGVVKLLLAEAEGPGKMFMVGNCSLFRFRFDGEGVELLERL